MTKKGYTHLTLVVDESGSMDSLRDDVITSINNLVDEHSEKNLTVSIFTFSNVVTQGQSFVKANKFDKLTRANYKPDGLTALNDAIGWAVERTGTHLAEIKESQRPSKVLVAVMTDGQENNSKDYGVTKVREMVERHTNTYNWEFLFLGANIDAQVTSKSYGMRESVQFEPTRGGVKAAYTVLSKSLVD